MRERYGSWYRRRYEVTIMRIYVKKQLIDA